MIVTQAQASFQLPSSDTPRAAGVHSSGLIRNIAIEMGILKYGLVEELSMADSRIITDEIAILRMAIGLAWEAWYIGIILAAQGVVKHPGEIHLDGIHMNPDGESVEKWQGPGAHKGKEVLIIHEVKATYKSTNTVGDASKEWMWLTQLKNYCKAEGTRFGKLHVLFLCGDYKFPIRPVISSWLFEFTQKELNDNWELMTDYKNARN